MSHDTMKGSEMKIQGYYYLHTNGSLIYKPYDEGRVADFRESDLVRTFWPFDPNDREQAWTICVEALASDALKARVFELAELWQINDADAPNYADRLGLVLGMDGDQCTANTAAFDSLATDPMGFGNSYLEAMADLCRQMGYKPSKMWGNSFKSRTGNVVGRPQ